MSIESDNKNPINYATVDQYKQLFLVSLKGLMPTRQSLKDGGKGALFGSGLFISAQVGGGLDGVSANSPVSNESFSFRVTPTEECDLTLTPTPTSTATPTEKKSTATSTNTTEFTVTPTPTATSTNTTEFTVTPTPTPTFTATIPTAVTPTPAKETEKTGGSDYIIPLMPKPAENTQKTGELKTISIKEPFSTDLDAILKDLKRIASTGVVGAAVGFTAGSFIGGLRRRKLTRDNGEEEVQISS